MTGTDAATKPKRILILGGGFGGVYTARSLEKKLRGQDVEITLVSRDNYFLMTPLLFEAGSGVLDPRHAVTPIRRMLEKTKFVEAEVEKIDIAGQRVIVRHSPETGTTTYQYDQLVLALGGVTNTSVIPGSEHAAPFKTLADSIHLRNHIIDRYEQADLPGTFLDRRKELTFVVIGAGLVGVELMGELTSFVRSISGAYRTAREQMPQFYLVEAGPRILPEMDEKLANYAHDVLEGRGVKMRPSSPAQQIESSRVTLKDGTVIDTETIILAAGVASNPLLAGVDVEKEKKGRIVVDAMMRSKSHRNVWAIGDCASIPDPSGKPYPQLAQHALREAKVLANNIAVELTGSGASKPFVYENMGTLAALGHFNGVGRVMMFKIRGFLAWWVWRSYYLMQMPGFERKVRIILDWTIALFFKYDVAKLDLYGNEHPIRKRRLAASASKAD